MSNRDYTAYAADEPVTLEFHSGRMWVTLADGRIIATPIAWYPPLVMATTEQLERYELSNMGIHWVELDEDISITSMLAGRKANYTLRQYVENGQKLPIPARDDDEEGWEDEDDALEADPAEQV